MEIQGRIIQIMPTQTGQGKSGVWAKQEFILETPGQYPKKVCMSLWGQEAIQKHDLETDMTITAHINIESREYNGRWYTDVRVWKIEHSDQKRAQQTATGPLDDPSDSGDLPF